MPLIFEAKPNCTHPSRPEPNDYEAGSIWECDDCKKWFKVTQSYFAEQGRGSSIISRWEIMTRHEIKNYYESKGIFSFRIED